MRKARPQGFHNRLFCGEALREKANATWLAVRQTIEYGHFPRHQDAFNEVAAEAAITVGNPLN